MKMTLLKYGIVACLCLSSLKAWSQDLTVLSVEPLENDLTANTNGTIELDQNGDKCALIKIETTEMGFSFDVGILGVVKTEQKVGEIWLYVPQGVKRISISHPRLEMLRNYDLGLSVKKAKTYLLKLRVNKTLSDGNLGTLDVHTSPDDAEIFLDEIQIGRTPLTFPHIIPGKHKVCIRKGGFFDYESEIQVDENKIVTIDETLTKSCDIVKGNNRINITIKGVPFTMVAVPGGTFDMGATSEQKKPQADEGPVHRVTLSDYYIGETEVTQALWAAVMGSNPSLSGFREPKMPVNQISWDDCQRFVFKLRQLTGMNFRLPTEAEWEFAARGGQQTRHYIYAGSNKAKDVAWYNKNAKNKIYDVGQKQPNELGLYDMSGSIFEWCQDWYGNYKSKEAKDPQGAETGENKVYRGGSAFNEETYLRISNRVYKDPSFKSQLVGMRLALTDI